MKRRWTGRILKAAVIGAAAVLLLVFGTDQYVKGSVKKQILTEALDSWNEAADAGCILVLGAGVWGDKPSPMLRDRLDKAVEAYKALSADGRHTAPKIVMSGDHGQKEYDEVNIMKDYAVKAGVPSSDVFMDHAGFSTYDSMYRLRHIFGAESAIVISQRYHLYRALYIGKALDMKVYGLPAADVTYRGAMQRELREILARDKDVLKCLTRPEASVMGEPVSLDGSGDVTND